MKKAAFLLACAIAGAHGLALAQPIRQHPQNPRYFEWRGKPLALITSAEHYGAVLNSDFNFTKYLATLAKDGLNYTRIFTGSYVEVPGSFGIVRNTLAPAAERFLSPWARSGSAGYAVGGNRFDLNQWNPAYFDRLRSFVREAAQRGIVVEVTLFCSTYEERMWKASPFHPGNNVNATDFQDWKRLNTPQNGAVLAYQEKLTRKIVRELNEFDNVIFELQNEPWADRPVPSGTINPFLRPNHRDTWPNSVDLADAESLAWQALVSGWIQAEEAQLPKKHLIAQNVCNFRYPVRDFAPGVSIVNFHYAFPEAAIWNQALHKVIGYDETGFLGNRDADYRKQAWNFVLAGGGLFNHLDYSFAVGFEDGTDRQEASPGGGSVALRQQVGLLAKFLAKLPFLSMTSQDSLVREAPGTVWRVLAAPGKAYAVYVMGGQPSHVLLNVPAGRWRVDWLDPLSGRSLKQEVVAALSDGLRLQPPVFSDDAALAITSEVRQ